MKTTQQSKTECNSHMCIIHFTSHCAHIAAMNRILWLVFERFLCNSAVSSGGMRSLPSISVFQFIIALGLSQNKKQKLEKKKQTEISPYNGFIVSAVLSVLVFFFSSSSSCLQSFSNSCYLFMPKISPMSLAVVFFLLISCEVEKNMFTEMHSQKKKRMLHSISSPYFQISSGLNICPLFNVRCFVHRHSVHCCCFRSKCKHLTIDWLMFYTLVFCRPLLLHTYLMCNMRAICLYVGLGYKQQSILFVYWFSRWNYNYPIWNPLNVPSTLPTSRLLFDTHTSHCAQLNYTFPEVFHFDNRA